MPAAIQQSQMESDRLSAIKTIDSEIRAIEELKKSLDAESLTKALDFMQNSTGRIIITGMGKSGHIGKKIAASLASTGTPSFFVHPAEASHGDLGMITDDDVVIAISNSGESRELIDILNYCKRFGIKLIAITKNQEKPAMWFYYFLITEKPARWDLHLQAQPLQLLYWEIFLQLE